VHSGGLPLNNYRPAAGGLEPPETVHRSDSIDHIHSAIVAQRGSGVAGFSWSPIRHTGAARSAMVMRDEAPPVRTDRSGTAMIERPPETFDPPSGRRRSFCYRAARTQ